MAAAIAVVVLTFNIASAAARPYSSGRSHPGNDLTESVEGEYPNSSRGSPMDLQNGTSPEQNADEGTLNQGPSEVDSEVGAGEHQVVEPQRSAEHSVTATWVVQGIVIFLAVVVVTAGVRLIFLPSDRIPRIGSPRTSTDA